MPLIPPSGQLRSCAATSSKVPRNEQWTHWNFLDALTPNLNRCVRSGSLSSSGGGGGLGTLPRNESITVKCCSRADSKACSQASLSLRVAAANLSEAPEAASTKSIGCRPASDAPDLTLVLSNGNVARGSESSSNEDSTQGPAYLEATSKET